MSGLRARDARRMGETSTIPGGPVRETASFRGDDQPCLVEAALACLACLSSDVEWALGLQAWEAEVTCRCLDCGHARTVALTGEQALRLALDDHHA